MRRNCGNGDSPRTVEALSGRLYTTKSRREKIKTSQAWFTGEGEESNQRNSTKRGDTTIPACWNCSIHQVPRILTIQRLWTVKLIYSATSPKTPKDFAVCTPFGSDTTPCYINNLPCLQLFEHMGTLSKTMMFAFESCSDQQLACTPLTTASAFDGHVLRHEHPGRLADSQGLVRQSARVLADSIGTSDAVRRKTCIAGFRKDDIGLDNFASLTSAKTLIRQYDTDADKSPASALPSVELSEMLLSMVYLASNNLITDCEASSAVQLLHRGDRLDLLTALASSSLPTIKALAKKFLPGAVESGDIKLVKTLLDTGIDVDSPFNYGSGTLLLVAVRQDNLKMVEFLLEQKADARRYPWVLCAAVMTGNLQLVKLLYDSRARDETRNRWTSSEAALQSAAKGGHVEIVKYLLSRGANVNFDAGWDSETVLQAAANTGIRDLVELILEHHPTDLHAALATAIDAGHDRIAMALIYQGIDLDPPDAETPLQAASRWGMKSW